MNRRVLGDCYSIVARSEKPERIYPFDVSTKYERAALKRQRELQREMKDMLKRSEQQQAALAVSEHEAKVAVLLSMHEEEVENTDWRKIACELRPPEWRDTDRHETRVKQNSLLQPSPEQVKWEQSMEEARSRDRAFNEEGRKNTAMEIARWERRTALARRILAGDTKAYMDALAEFSPLAEMVDLGSSMDFSMHSPRLVECSIAVKASDVIPSEVKSLTASGKLSSKAMPRARFHEIYQDYVCGCLLRLAREVFALLPVETFIATALTQLTGERGAEAAAVPVLSVIFPRAELAKLDFSNRDASDTVELFVHRGDFKATRKSGAFQAILPFARDDVPRPPGAISDLEGLLALAANLRNQIRAGLT